MRNALGQFVPGHANANPELRGCFRDGVSRNAGEAHPQWMGAEASYSSKHKWISRQKGKPERCVDCGATSAERRIYWSNVSHKYLRELSDYVGRCASCHYYYDHS